MPGGRGGGAGRGGAGGGGGGGGGHRGKAEDVGVDGEVWAGEVEEQHARDCLGPCRGE